MRVGAWQVTVDRRRECLDGFRAAIGFLQHVTEPEIRLRVRGIRAQDVAQRALERRARQLAGRHACDLRGEFLSIFRIRTRTAAVAASRCVAKGLQPRDVILSIGQRPVANTAEAVAAVEAAKKAGFKTVLLLVQRGNRPATYLGVDLTGK